MTNKFLLSIHPMIQFLAILLACYVFYLGFQRFKFLHLKQKASFNWKGHVILGAIALVTWAGGFFSGIIMVYIHWGKFLMTGTHGKVALVMFPLILFGLFSGLYMDRIKKQRVFLPVIHGLSNLVALVLAITQIATGWSVYNIFVLV